MTKAQKNGLIILLAGLLAPSVLIFIARGALSPSQYLIAKTIFSLGFVLYALVKTYRSRTKDRLSVFVICALVLGMLGDIYIALANRLEGIGFAQGFLLFLAQHLVLCVGMIVCVKDTGRRKKLLIAMPAAAAGTCLYVLALRLIGGDAIGKVVIAIGVYGMILVWTAVIPFTLREKKDPRLLIFGIAGILFFIADSMLICGLIENAPPVLSAMNLIPYYYAQYLIAFAAALAGEKKEA